MEHLTKKGESKIVPRCTYPVTGLNCVNRIYTDLAVIDVTPQGLRVVDIVDGLSLAELAELSGVELKRRD
jgi:3-oxoadipate CoA-transferase beta subunit